MAYLLMALVFAIQASADAMIEESRDSARSGFFDAAATLAGQADGLIVSAKVILAVAVSAWVLALVFAIFAIFARKRQQPAAAALADSLDHVRVAVDRIMQAGAEVGDIETLRSKIAAERTELEALRETTVEQRQAVLAQSGTKKWTVISIVAGLVGSAGLAVAMDSILDRL